MATTRAEVERVARLMHDAYTAYRKTGISWSALSPMARKNYCAVASAVIRDRAKPKGAKR